MSGEHGHQDLADQIASVHLDLVAAANRLGTGEAAQAATDAAVRSLLARVATLEEAIALPGPVDPPPATGWSTNGIPPKGKTLAGAAVQDSSEATAVAFETLVGAQLGIRRSYFSSSQQSTAVTTATANLAAGRIPWVSFKLPSNGQPGNWAKAATGAYDAWAKDIADRLSALPGPVWLAIHHEPEGDPDGTTAEWVAAQRRLSPIFRAKPNIAYSIILTGWTQFFGTGKVEDYWPGAEHVDIFGWDPYNWYGADGKTTFTEMSTYTSKIAAWIASNAPAVAWAIAETGYTDAAATKDAAWLTRAFDSVKADGGIALTYFSYLTTSGYTWPIKTEPKVSTMRAVLARADRLP